MQLRNWLSVVCVVLVGVWAGPFVADEAYASGGEEDNAGARVELRTWLGTFDPTVEPWPAAALGTEALPLSAKYFIVQFDRPLEPEDWLRLTSASRAIIEYVPDNGYLVRAESADQLSALPHARWAGGMPMSLKLLTGMPDTSSPLIVDVHLFPDVSADRAVKVLELVARHGQVVEQGERWVTVRAPSSSLRQLAAIEEVGSLAPHSQIAFAMDNVRVYTSAESLFGLSPAISGNGVIGEIVDDGIDEGHWCFPTVNVLGSPPTLQFHGTATFGELFSTGTDKRGGGAPPEESAKCIRARGMLPSADRTYFRISSAVSIEDSVRELRAEFQRFSPVLGSVGALQSNSWGPACEPDVQPFGPWNQLCKDLFSVFPLGADDSFYDRHAQLADRAVFGDDVSREAYVTVVYAAGNSDLSVDRFTISRVATAKNVITAGGLDHRNNAERLDDCWIDRGREGTPSRGPTADLRVKPDLIGPFYAVFTTDVRGVGGEFPGDYIDESAPPPPGRPPLMGGTSAATPVVAGAAGLVVSLDKAVRFGRDPTVVGRLQASTVKAILIANAFQLPMGNDNPLCATLTDRYVTGWGIVDLQRVYDVGPQHLIVNEETPALAGSAANAHFYLVDKPEMLKISLVWTDPPGSIITPVSEPKLVNNLDLVVTSPTGTVYCGNFGLLSSSRWSDPCNPESLGSLDTRNNVENVFLSAPATGRWTIEVRPTGINQDATPLATPALLDQPYALVVSHSGQQEAPSQVTDLQVRREAVGSLRLAWTAPGDDGGVGTASEYDIRYRTDAPVTEANWNTSTQVAGEPLPRFAGTAESFVVSGLNCVPAIRYHFAIKARDEAYNWAQLSNPNPPGICAEGEISSLWTSQNPASQVPSVIYDYPDGGGTQTFYIRAPKRPNQAYFNAASFTLTGLTRTLTYSNTFDMGLDADESQGLSVQDGNAILTQSGGQSDQQSLATDFQWDVKGFEGLAQGFKPNQSNLQRVDLYLHVVAGPPGGDPADPDPLTLTVRIQTAVPCPLEGACILGTSSFTFTSTHDGWWPFPFSVAGLTPETTYWIVIDGFEGAPGILDFEGSVFGGQMNPYSRGEAWAKRWQQSWQCSSGNPPNCPRDLAFKTWSMAPGYATSGYLIRTIDRVSPIANARLNMDQTSPTGTSVQTLVYNWGTGLFDDFGTGDKQWVNLDLNKYTNSEWQIRVKFVLTGPGTTTPYLHDFSIETDHVPENVLVFVGTDQIRSYSGPLTTQIVGDVPPPPLWQALTDYLDASTPGPDGYVWIPIEVRSDTAGTIRVSSVMMLYCW